MKVLLTTIKSESADTQTTLKYLYSILADAPIEVDVKEFPEKELLSEMYSDVIRGQYNMVYMHCDEYNEARISALSELIKKAAPTSVMMIGGLQVSYGTKEYMEENPWVDFVVRGEPEKVIFNFVKTMLTFEFDFEGIAGLAFRANDRIFINPLDEPVAAEDLPFPYEKTALDECSVVYYETIRGCSDRSTYSQHMQDARVRALSLNRVCTELRYFLVKSVDRVIITDRYFNYDTERAYRIWEYIISNDNGHSSFVFDVNGDLLDDETIRMLKGAREGLFIFNIDVESTNAEVLSAVGRKENIYQLFYNTSKLLQQTSVSVKLNLTLGLPYEDEQMFARSFNKTYGIGAQEISITTLRMKKGIDLIQDADRFGYQYSSRSPYEVVANDYLHAPDYIRIRDIANLIEAYSCGGFNDSVQTLMHDTGYKPYDFFAKLAEFISANGYEKQLRKKENLYRVLYAFAANTYDELNDTLRMQIFAEALHSDFEGSFPEETVKKFDRKGWEL